MALKNKDSAMNKMSRCLTRDLAPVHSRRGREWDCEFRTRIGLMRLWADLVACEWRKGEREETKEEKVGRERGAGLGWRKGLSARLEWKDDERQGLIKYRRPKVAYWIEHWTPDRKAWVRCPATKTLRVHTKYVLVKSVGPRSCGLSHERRDWRIFPSPQVPCLNCGGGDRWCHHLS
ncbi:hypothetical protein TNCV_31431 [Trichonephila clavipes]|nr:hypothetical protein TNCV_31431 [Trichonephila clavipes]